MKPLIVIVSNRGPFSFKKNADGTYRVERGAGGLVTALGALAEQHDVVWVAAAMDKDDRLWVEDQSDEPQQVEGISLRLIKPNKKAYQGYYNVISNPMLWFIQHQLWDTPRNPSITQETWDAWRVLPTQMRAAILTSLLQADRVGFQTRKDAFNFVQTCRFYLQGAHSRGTRDTIFYENREIKAVAYPISIDAKKLETLGEEPQTHLLKTQLYNFVGDRKLILRVDRIEPSKNILRGLEAYRTLLETHPEHRNKIQMMALLVPSRMEVDEYQDYLRDIMSEAGMINANYSTSYWEPVRIVVGDNYERAIAAMQLYDVLLVNPLADGMNLVAKEGALVNQRDGVLVLSENAGVFYELGEQALTVSPFDIYGTANALHQALTMPPEEKRKRAEELRAHVKKADIRSWFYDQVDDAMRVLDSQPKKDSTPATS